MAKMKKNKETREILKKYNHFQLSNMYISKCIQVESLKKEIDILRVERAYFEDEYNKMVSKIKTISKELILAKKELMESKE